MKFRTKPIEVEAYQVPPLDGHTRMLPPPWVVEGIINQRLRPQPEGGILLNVSTGETRALVDDWLVRTPDGEISVCTPTEFAERYERVLA